MSGDVTKQSLKRQSFLPERDDTNNGSLIAGQEYDNVYFQGGVADNITLNSVVLNNPTLNGVDGITFDSPIVPSSGGTGIANADSSTLTMGGAVTFSGDYIYTATLTANTAVTYPTTGTLATLAGAETLTNKSLTSPILTGTPIVDVAQTSGSSGVQLKSSAGANAFVAGMAGTTNCSVVGALTLGSPLTYTYGGTGFGSYTMGDMLYANGSGVLAKRAIGTNGQIMSVSLGLPVWINYNPLTDGDKGDITVSASGATFTIDDNAVTTSKILDSNVTTSKIGDNNVTTAKVLDNNITNAKLAQVATARFKGRVTAATGNVEDLTGTQATTLLDTFTSGLKGLTPASGGGTANFLRADGTWVNQNYDIIQDWTSAAGTAVSSLSIAALANYSNFEVEFDGIYGVSNAFLLWQLAQGGALISSSNYDTTLTFLNTGAASSRLTADFSNIELSSRSAAAEYISNSAAAGYSGSIKYINHNSTTINKRGFINGSWNRATSNLSSCVVGHSVLKLTPAITGFAFFMSTGNIAGGRYRIIGYK